MIAEHLPLDLPESVTANGPHFWIVVEGKVEPAGSKTGFVNPNGGVIITDANKNLKPWKAEVARQAREALDANPQITASGLWDGPIAAEFIFYRERPKSHYGTGRNSSLLKPSAPPYPIAAPDALKCARGAEDSLSGVLYTDDSRIVAERLLKVWADPDPARIEIRAWLL